MSIGVGIFLMVLGAILAFAVETVPGINRRRLVGGTRPVEVVEERPLDDGLP